MVKNFSKHFVKEEIQTADKHVKRCSISLIIKKMHIEMTEILLHIYIYPTDNKNLTLPSV